MASGPHHQRLDKALKMGELLTEIEIEVGEPSSSVWARVTEEA